MNYRVLAIGKLKRDFIKEGCAFYQKRLASLSTITIQEIKAIKGAQAPQKESKALLKAAEGYTVSLDENGKHMSSPKLATHISTLETQGIRTVNLLIGGAEGHSELLKASVNESWSLSLLTLPHEMVRLVLLEQLYRIETIRAGHPYHRA